ncbi:uncharacterized protein LOC112170737 isoform X2 [Rosa chinensis]|uniref:uncharacterized protein LOC112170737 isoform X2 n=1 Tax=Rosa chinensis TaxID=74649 RepID=UPI001AD92BFB|nr:uncharacterized protein LOC112170737 isoform X2 [Rosa chinensis]
MARGHKHHDCPTTSKTKRKFCSQPSQSEVDEVVIDDGVDTTEEQACEPFADADEPLSGPFPGGPHDPSVLKSFKSHVAAAIWFNKEREPLKLQNHSYKLTQWVFDEHVANHKFWSYIDGSRLRPLVNCSYLIGNRVVVSTFCERWQPETNTFHLPFGLSLVYVQALRQQLDHMHAHEVIWDPYRGHREAHPLLEITFYTGMLKCLDIVEPYYPDRVLRQFGRVQTIRHNPYTPSRVRRVSDSKSYKVVYEYFDGLWQRWRDHVLADANRTIPLIQMRKIILYSEYHGHCVSLTLLLMLAEMML